VFICRDSFGGGGDLAGDLTLDLFGDFGDNLAGDYWAVVLAGDCSFESCG
jgi:hypothetical protein